MQRNLQSRLYVNKYMDGGFGLFKHPFCTVPIFIEISSDSNSLNVINIGM